MADYYEILGIDKNATKEDIKSAFRKMARKYHPDINKEPGAEEKFKEIGKAYETLMDDDKRALYDRYGEDGLKNAGYSTNGPFDFGFGNLNDIFESFFGSAFGGFGQSNPNAPQIGADLRLDLKIDFKEAVFGVEKEVTIDHLETCETCHGTGAKEGSQPQTCPQCGGSGRVQQVHQTILGSISQVTTCPQCHGKGTIIKDFCPDCKGQGKVQKEKKLKIKIPKGVDAGSRIRVASEGDAGSNGGPNGDLFVVLYVKRDKYFKRDGFNIYTELNISLPQAVLGDEVEIETLDGSEKIQIPSGCEYDRIITLKGKGVPVLGSPNMRGDHYVVVKLQTPKKLSDEEKKLYERLFELSHGKAPSQNGQSILSKVKSALKN